MNTENENKRIVEIHGIKMEVDLRYAKRIDTYRVGDAVKILIKKYSDYIAYPGIIVGFSDFEKLPAIDILYLDESDIKLYTFSDKSESAEIAPFNEYEMVFTRADVLSRIDRKISQKEEEIRVLKNKRKAFELHFGKAFEKELVGDNPPL